VKVAFQNLKLKLKPKTFKPSRGKFGAA
jgi:hypothetical protein